MTEQELQNALHALILELPERLDPDDEGDDPADHLAGIEEATTFGDAGLLTANKGLVLAFEGGEVFQVTIVRVR